MTNLEHSNENYLKVDLERKAAGPYCIVSYGCRFLVENITRSDDYFPRFSYKVIR